VIADPNSLAVIAVLFQLTTATSDPLIAGLQPHIAAISQPGTKTAIESGLDFSNLINHVQTTDLFTYTGSLTTPPCAEGITFLIAREPLAIDVDTFNEIKSVVKFNSRYTQNVLGEENLIGVGMVAGTEQQFEPPAPVAVEPTPAAPPAEITKGATVVISEVAGQPTSLLGVIVKGR
jgi:hypothetical protein